MWPRCTHSEQPCRGPCQPALLCDSVIRRGVHPGGPPAPTTTQLHPSEGSPVPAWSQSQPHQLDLCPPWGAGRAAGGGCSSYPRWGLSQGGLNEPRPIETSRITQQEMVVAEPRSSTVRPPRPSLTRPPGAGAAAALPRHGHAAVVGCILAGLVARGRACLSAPGAGKRRI